MALSFTKMHGLGNDFVVLDARAAPLALDAAQVRAMADRHTGVGFDQLLVVGRAHDAGCAAAYTIFNADGSTAGQCGNGARCIVAWLRRDSSVACGTSIKLESPAGVIGARYDSDTDIAIEMGEPVFDPARIPFRAPAEAATYPLVVDGAQIEISAASMGNPHALLEVADVHAPEVDRLGPLITGHARFPEGVNAGFATVVDTHAIRLRVHERGAGWTLACGSGACAAVAALHRRHRVGDTVEVALPGGTLLIEWRGAGHPLWMTGPAAFVFDGTWLPE
ncbi:MAG TPA: diaminopimelate epimerase [Rhodanobacteraceae bacterium]